MKHNLSKNQAGYALLLMVIALMGVGGVVMTGFTQDVKLQAERKQYLHNQRVLAEAKQALLQYAYNYPQMGNGPVPQGPGRLPCPDIDSPGTPNSGLPNSFSNCIDSGTAMVGRFPWRDPDMHFYEAMDASGEPLWYAVSSNFAYGAGTPVLNSDTTGTITIEDRSGAVLHDGAANNGVAAVIIAPGAALARGGVQQDRAAGPTVAANYLDLFGTVDNADFINNNGNGFVTGPIFNPVDGSLAINDQMIVITTAEVIAMAEKATLQAYREAINDYLANTGGIYPWLDDFTTDSLTEYDADINSYKGRLPALFGNYFGAGAPPTPAIVSDLRLTLYIDDLVIAESVAASASPDIFFDADGDLVTAFPPGIATTYYFWDGHPTDTPTLPMDGVWELCPGTTGTEDDCNLDTAGNWKGAASTESDIWTQVRRVTVTLTSTDNPFQFLNTDLNPLPVVAPTVPYIPAAVGTNAYVFREFNNNSGYLTVFNEYDQDFRDDFDVQVSGNLVFDGSDRFAVGMIYYPELPFWAIGNNWHHSVQFAIAEDYKPDGNNADCTVNGCLVVNNLAGVNNDKISLLVIAGEVDNLIDDGAAGFFDDLNAQFAAENTTANAIYDRIAENDRVMVVQ